MKIYKTVQDYLRQKTVHTKPTQKPVEIAIAQEKKVGDVEMVDVDFPELPKIRRTKIEKFIDIFSGSIEELKNIFVTYNTDLVIYYKDLRRQINQTAFAHFKKQNLRLFS